MGSVAYSADRRAEVFFASFPSRRLNLGCGTDIRAEYTNVDMHDYGQANTIVGDVRNLNTLPSGNFDEIVAWDILEHIRHRETNDVLFEWNRLLGMGGRLNIRTTYLNGLVRLMEDSSYQTVKGQMILLTNLFSRQLIDGDYHLNAFTEPMIRFNLWATGFEIEDVSIRDGWIWDIWAVKSRSLVEPDLLDADDGAEDFVRRAYVRILGREADPEGLSVILERMADHWSREEVVRFLWSSEEHQASLVETAPVFSDPQPTQ